MLLFLNKFLNYFTFLWIKFLINVNLRYKRNGNVYGIKLNLWYHGNILLQFIPMKLVKGDEIFLDNDHQWVETVTLCCCANMLPNMNKCEHGWTNFSESFTAVALKFIELFRSELPNHWFSSISYVPLFDHDSREIVHEQ